MATITWKIPNNGLLAQTLDNKKDVVSLIRYTITATDGKNTVEDNGVVKIDFNENKPFTVYKDLTEAVVLQWVKESLGDDRVAVVESRLKKRLETLSNSKELPKPIENPWK